MLVCGRCDSRLSCVDRVFRKSSQHSYASAVVPVRPDRVLPVLRCMLAILTHECRFSSLLRVRMCPGLHLLFIRLSVVVSSVRWVNPSHVMQLFGCVVRAKLSYTAPHVSIACCLVLA